MVCGTENVVLSWLPNKNFIMCGQVYKSMLLYLGCNLSKLVTFWSCDWPTLLLFDVLNVILGSVWKEYDARVMVALLDNSTHMC